MGIGAAIAAVASAIVEGVGDALVAVGVDSAFAATIAPAIAGGLEGAGGGALLGAITGGNVGRDALLGGLTGGAVGGLGPALGSATGLGTVGGDVLAGAGAGAVGGAITGTSPLTGALTGGAGGLASGLIAGAGGTGGAGGAAAPSAGGDVGTGAGAAGAAAPAGAVPSGGLTLADPGTPGLPDLLGPPGAVTGAGSTGGLDPNSVAGGALGGGGAAAGSGAAASGGLGGGSSGLLGGNLNLFASTAGDASAAAPTGADPSTIGGPASAPPSASDSIGNLARSLGLGNNADLVGAGGNYILPPPAPIAEGSPVVSPTTGAITSPGDTGYDQAVNALSATPTIPATPADASGSGLGGGFGSTLKSLAPVAALGGIGLDLLKGSTPVAGQAALSSEASQLSAQGQQLQSYLQSGTLPAGVQQSITQAANQAKAAIRSRYAQTGGDTSAMQQDLSNIDQTAATQGANIAMNLLQQGVNETQLSSQLYGQLMNVALQQNAQLGQAIGNFAISAAGQPRVLQLTG
jgi:hypothetical protein